MRRILVALIVVAALVIGVRLADTGGASPATEPTLSTPDNSDYYIQDAVVHQMDENGDLAYRMTLGQTLHFPDDSARLTNIDVRYLAGTQTYWDIKAMRGRVPSGKRDVYLYGGVEGHHPMPDDTTIDIATDNAWIRPQADRVDTQAHVTATRSGQRVEGDGMEVDLKKDELKLLDNVQTIYTP